MPTVAPIRSSRLRRLARPLAMALAIASLALGIRPAGAQVADSLLWSANAPVNSVVRVGNTLYLGGEFTYVGPATPYGLPLDAVSGAVLNPFPKLAGPVFAALPDGAGGWYLGGDLVRVNGVARTGLAHILADGSLVTWAGQTNSSVTNLALWNGRLYFAGNFTEVDGLPRNGLAAVDATTGALLPWNPTPAGGIVTCMIASGSAIYVGGGFGTINGVSRPNLAALDPETGAATAWSPAPDGGVAALGELGGKLIVAGNFAHIGGQPRLDLAALDTTTALATGWDPNAGGGELYLQSMTVSATTVYVGGAFITVGVTPRSHIAAFNGTTGALLPWNPGLDSGGTVYAFATDGTTVWMGGSFGTIGGQPRNYIGAVDAVSGAVRTFAPEPNGTVISIAIGSGQLFMGGTYSSVNGQVRNHLAAFDVTSGTVTSWNPNASSVVITLAGDATTIYAGGYFAAVGGQTRHGLAAIGASTGTVSTWNPAPAGSFPYVFSLVLNGSTLYAGGDFTSIGGRTLPGVAALSTSTGLASAWPAADSSALIRAMALDGGTLYVGGIFTRLFGQTRHYIAALDATTGALKPWNPHAESGVLALAVGPGRVYAGGGYTSIGGANRENLAALDPATGTALPWAPEPDGFVRALAVSGETVYVGGSFSNIGGGNVPYVAALDTLSGWASGWDPHANDTVRGLSVVGSTVYACGDFVVIGNAPHYFVAALQDRPTGVVLARFDATITTGGVRLLWEFGDTPATDARIERADGPAGPWTLLSLVVTERAGLAEATDTGTEPGREYWYRLTATLQGTPHSFGPIAARTPAALTLSGPTRVWPNPTRGRVRIEYEVAAREQARLEVLDIAGRSVAVLADGFMAAGRYDLSWDGRVDGATLPAGVYFVRWRSAGRSVTQRIAIVR